MRKTRRSETSLHFSYAFRSLSIVLIAESLASFYYQWQLFIRHVPRIPRPFPPPAGWGWCMHTNRSLVADHVPSPDVHRKLLYTLLASGEFYELLLRLYRHELLLQCPVRGATRWPTCHLIQSVIVVTDLPIADSLRQQVEGIMDRYWVSTRRQLLFYLFSCICIMLNFTLDGQQSVSLLQP